MTTLQFILFTLILAASVMITRYLPFILFGSRREPPAIIDYLGKVLPAAMMGLLVVYCFKDTDPSSAEELVPAILASAVTAGLHLWKRNTILSIAAGTAVYMVLLAVL